MRIGLITNAQSTRNRRGLDRIRAVVARHPGTSHAELADVRHLEPTLAAFARDGIGLIVINGGDGTVQTALTALVNSGAYPALPRVAVLAGGMTNSIAIDVGVRGRPDKALDRLCRRVGEGAPLPCARRALIGVRMGADALPKYGLFLGAGAFHDGVLLVRRKVHPLGVERTMATGMGLGYAAIDVLRGKRARRGTAYTGVPLSIRADGRPAFGERGFLLLGTTLERLMLRLWPFWSDGAGDLRLTAVEHPPAHLAWALPFALFGRPRPWMAGAGYTSLRARRATLELEGPLVLDGEFLPPSPDGQVLLDTDHAIDFVAL
ncbi:diacylglycerol/lipid kinase family protein [Marinivivus vitaminiproducens]|uniref:diacylglycerol/lipid kinase family protein n=1 Tax=Marinivivus vitaminiproducens TaxID=3035935 RepID=UPI0027A63FAC|nr:diacylglycerol kinase family protein [Geminicoccaceae bacterium SCSIO 64248]